MNIRTKKWILTFISAFVLGYEISSFRNMYACTKESVKEAIRMGTNLVNDRAEEKSSSSLLILPKIASSSTTTTTIGVFFAKYTDKTSGWMDIDQLSMDDITSLRTMGKSISGFELKCGYPQVHSVATIINKNNESKYCMWDNDHVSRKALEDFDFEKPLWTWVVHAFSDLRRDYPHLHLDNNNTKQICSQQQQHNKPGFLDIGINVGDWISPIRLLDPELPIYGVEGSPPTAAIASANLRTSVQYHLHKTSTNRLPGPSKILPFSLMALAQKNDIAQRGGVCFSKPQYYGGNVNAYNVGGRNIKASQPDCPESSSAGATTLLHALQGLSCTNNNDGTVSFPNIFIMKIDVEQYEFKALSSVIPWLSTKPPCYLFIEYTKGESSSTAVVELLMDLGYDLVWRPREGEFPSNSQITDPWWDNRKHPGGLQGAIHQKVKYYEELLFGFSNVSACLENFQR